MKKLLFLLIATGGALSAIAQTTAYHRMDSAGTRHHYAQDALLSHWVVDINLLGGGVTQTYTTLNTLNNYYNAIGSVSNTGKLSFANGYGYGFDAQLAYFFGRGNHFGIGAGFMYMGEQGDATLDQFNVQYQSTDSKGQTFRQLISANGPIKEHLNISNMNIPVLLKYKHRLSHKWGVTADAGALINLQMKSMYNSNANFNYEAIYQVSGDGSTVYDNAATPASTDILYTKAEYNRVNPGLNANNYFNNTLRGEGYNVGLGVTPNNNSGTISYMTGSVGLLVQPGVNYYLSDMVALNLGLYFLYQPMTNTTTNTGSMLTNHVGDYTSVLNTSKDAANMSYGLNVGVRVYLGKKFVPLSISSADGIAPSACGLCDGNIVLHGLIPDKQVTVSYARNGASQPSYSGTVAPDGSVQLTGLCAGTYTGITAKEGRQSANGQEVMLDNPPVRITTENSTNPTANGVCDGTISLYGLRAGQAVKVTYNVDGSPQNFTGYVGQDNSVTLTHLCAGYYSGIVATVGKCAANGTDVTLTSPPPPPPPPAPAPPEDHISTPIMFEVNKTVIHKSSYPTLIEAADKLNAEKDSYIIVDGYTDATGTKTYNKKLSLRRARAVKQHLVNMGISPKRIKIVGHGEDSPAATNDTQEGRMQNRRAVMHLTVGE